MLANQLVDAVEQLEGTSVEKTIAFMTVLNGIDDRTLDEAVPFASPQILRMVMATAAGSIPDDPGQFDQTLKQISDFVLFLRSDDAPDA